MKNFWKLLCSLCVCVTLTACGNKIDESALTAFEDAAAKMGEWNSFGYEGNIDIALDEDKGSIKLQGEVIMPKEDALLPEMSLTMNLLSPDQEEKMEMYLHDDIMYSHTEYVKIKEDFSKENMPKISIGTDAWKPYLKSASKDGNILRFEFDEEEFLKNERLNYPLFGEFHSLLWEVNLNEDGSIRSFSLHIEGDFNDALTETIMDMNINMDFQFKDVNKIDSLTLPDLSDYRDREFTIQK